MCRLRIGGPLARAVLHELFYRLQCALRVASALVATLMNRMHIGIEAVFIRVGGEDVAVARDAAQQRCVCRAQMSPCQSCCNSANGIVRDAMGSAACVA